LAGEHAQEHERRGKVEAAAGSFRFCAAFEANDLGICAPGSLDEFLLERYTAFTQFQKRRQFFRIWHEPWQQVRAKVQIATDNLIHSTGRWWRDARCIGANYSPWVNVWMGWPHAIKSPGGVSSASEELILLIRNYAPSKSSREPRLGWSGFMRALCQRFCSCARMKSILCKRHIWYGGHRN
jgi:hypothetical protein